MNYYQIPNDPRNTLLNLLKNQNIKDKDKNKKEMPSWANKPDSELSAFEREEKRIFENRQKQKINSINNKPSIEKPVIPVMLPNNESKNNGLLSEEDEKKVEERLNKDVNAKNKYTKAGNFFARVGGFNFPAPTQEQIEQASPEQLDYFNKQRLAARNKGIGEMLLLLGDAFGGKDIAGRAMERRLAKQPKEKSVSEIRSSILSKLMIPGGKISRTEFNTLVGIDPNYRDLAITNPELFDFTDDESGVPQGFSGTPDQWNLLKESNPDKPDEDLIKYFNENYGV